MFNSSWREVKIGSLGSVLTGKTPPTAKQHYFGRDYPFITPTDIDGIKREVKTERFLSESGKEYLGNLLLPPNTVCFVCIGATIGKMCMTDQPSITNQQVNSIIVDEENFDPRFVYYALRYATPRVINVSSGAATTKFD
ncbi:MAG: restriction endonuclease subunit S [Chloroflexota bacterium]